MKTLWILLFAFGFIHSQLIFNQYSQLLLPQFAYTWVEPNIQLYLPLFDSPRIDICSTAKQSMQQQNLTCTSLFCNRNTSMSEQLATIYNYCTWCSGVSDSSAFQACSSNITNLNMNSCDQQGIPFVFYDSNSGTIGKACYCKESNFYSSSCSPIHTSLLTWNHITGKAITLLISSLIILLVLFALIIPYFGSAIYRAKSVKQLCLHLLFKWKVWAYVFLLASAICLLLDAAAMSTVTNYVHTLSGISFHGKVVYYAAFSILHCFSCVFIIIIDGMTRLPSIKERKILRVGLLLVETVVGIVLLVYTTIDILAIVYTLVVDSVIVTVSHRNLYYAILFSIYSVLTILYSFGILGFGIMLLGIIFVVPFENPKWTKRNTLFGIFLIVFFAWITLLMGVSMLLHNMQWYGYLMHEFNIISLILVYGTVSFALLSGTLSLINGTEFKETYFLFYKASCIQHVLRRKSTDK